MLGVLAVHFSGEFPFPEAMANVMSIGKRGVQVFFALSAYLACAYFFKAGATYGTYYKRRALRILPTYYAAITAALVYIEYCVGGSSQDVFHLGWLRYYLGLNTILPSTDFGMWNNLFGMWCMTDFIFFYAVVPVIIHYVVNYRRAVIWVIICVLLAVLAKKLSKQMGSDYFSDLPWMIKWSPLGQMQHFALGMLTFFAIRANKVRITAIVMGIALLCSLRSELSGSTFACLVLLLLHKDALNLKGWSLSGLKFVSKYSFHVYLSHPLALAIANRYSEACVSYCPGIGYYGVKFLIVGLSIIILCSFMEFVQRVSNRLFSV